MPVPQDTLPKIHLLCVCTPVILESTEITEIKLNWQEIQYEIETLATQ